jgi:hypothetical protein
MTAQDTLRHDVLALRDIVEARDAESASITYTTDPSTVLTYTRELGAVLVAGERTLAIPEDWIEAHGLVPIPSDQSMEEDR